MLIEFSVGNYRSFKDIQTLHLQAANITSKDKTIDKNNVFPVNQKLSLLKSKAIYGANASGKSNLVLAIRAFKKIVSSSLKDEKIIPIQGVEKFRLSDDASNSPMFFQIIFIDSGIIYRYGFEIHNNKISAEWLYGIPNEKEVYFFRREGMDVKINEKKFKEGKRIVPTSADEIPLFQPTSLFLAVVAAFNGPLSKSLITSIDGIKGLSSLPNHLPDSIKKELRNVQQLNKINKILKAFDLGIEYVLSADLGDALAETLNFSEKEKLLKENLKSLNDAVIVLRKKYDEDGNETGKAFFFLDDEEAEGSKKLVITSPFIIEALEKGTPLVIDEFDAKLHPNLTRKIVELFHNPSINVRNAQLIFVTHDSNLLDQNLLRRDQICFVEKDKFGASNLIDLAEYKGVRYDASYEKDYLKGKYGAIPYLGRFEQAFEN